MKRCPTCNKTYSDDSMSFCLEDGAPLLTVGGGDIPTPPNFDPNMTIPYTPPRDTTGQPSSDLYQGPGSQPGSQWPGAGGPPSSPPSGFGQQPGGPPSSGGSGYGQGGGQYGQSGGQYGGPPSGQFPPPSGQFPPPQIPPPQSNQYQPTPSWSPQPPPSYAPTAAKKSSALPWVLGGIGLLLVLGVVGAVIIGVLASMSDDNTNKNKNNSNSSNSTANKSNRNSSSSNSNADNSNSNSNTSAGTPSLRDDFSKQQWWTGTVNVGSAWYASDEYHLKGNEGGYMVVYGPKTNDYHTENARTLVTARSVTGNSPSLGFGLSVFGEMKNNILEDYSFLIRTGAGGDPAYRIVLHQAGKENVLVPWTSSSVIRTGTSPNQLEVRTEGKKLTFYINGQYITSINDDVNYGAGLAGLYTSDTDEVAFDDLEIYKN